MVPKIHAKGTSFIGAANYVLHDKGRSKTSERVDWTDVRNLAVDDPRLAARIMAATAMDAERLKAEAGVSKSGRRSPQTVLHLTLSWHPDESHTLTPEEMKRAAYGAIRALGAEDRQALIVGHNDEQQPHLHIILNRISPNDGRMLTSSKDRLKLSRFAQRYEEERGHVFCDERVVNNAARDRGEYVKGEPSTPRHIYELQASNDNGRDPDSRRKAEAIKAQQKQRDQGIGRKQRAMREAQATAWKKLAEEQRQHRQQVREEIRKAAAIARQKVRDSYRERWRKRHQEKQFETARFRDNEEHFTGRIKNRLKTIDFKAMLQSGERRRAIGDAFGALASSGARAEQLKRRQEQADRELKARQETEARKAAKVARAAAAEQQRRMREEFEIKRADLLLGQAMQHARLRAEWRQRSRDREAVWQKHRQQVKANLSEARVREGQDREQHPKTMVDREPSTREVNRIANGKAALDGGTEQPRSGKCERQERLDRFAEQQRRRRQDGNDKLKH